jgi:hypothetical protein
MPSLSLADVRSAMLEKLQSSLLTGKHAKLLSIEPMTEELAKRAGVEPPWSGFAIPYFEPSGALAEDKFWRYRFWPESRPSRGWAAIAEPSTLRYVQAKNSEAHVYMPPLLLGGAKWTDVMESPDCELDITEGELKSACACAQGRVMLGLGGVFSWMSKRHQQPLLPILEEFNWVGRRVNLAFDSDKSTKPLVQLALSRLAITLTARGARVYDVTIPPAAADGSVKQGVDDFMAASGLAAYEDLVKVAKPVQASLELHRLNSEVAMVWSGGAKGNIVRAEDGCLIPARQFTSVFYRDRTYMEFAINKAGEPAPPKLKYAAEEWLGWPCRTKIRELTYAPGEAHITANNDFNVWQDTGVRPVRGNIGPWEALIARMFPGANPDHVTWFKRWLAYPLRHPGTKMFSCVLVWSHNGGTGKNLLAETMFPIYGASNCTVIKSKHLTGDFNGWAEGKQFIVGDEITLDDKRHTSGDLKSMLTSRVVRINRKGIEAYEMPDCCNFYFTSNDPVALMLDQGERRTFVRHVPETKVGNDYGTHYMEWVAAGGAAAVAWYLIEELGMGDFSPTAEPPDTADKLDMIANSRSDIDTWAAALRMDPASVLLSKLDNAKFAAGGGRGVYSVYTPEELLKLYDPEDKKRCSMRALGIALDRAGFRKAQWNTARLNNVRTTFWLIEDPKPDALPITSSEALMIYKAERPDVFQLPSDKKTGKRKAN